MDWTDRVKSKALEAAEYVAKGFHAIPKKDVNTIKMLPSMHRLLNVVGMVGGFASAKYLSDIIFGVRNNGSNYEEIPIEQVPKPLRFLHGIAHYEPYSDLPHDQWMKVLHQMIPATAGAVGAIKGSEIFFLHQNRREKDVYNTLKAKKHLTPHEADSIRSYEQGKVFRVLAGATAWVSSASGLTTLYGMFLNPAFNFCNGGKFFAGLEELTGIKLFRKFSNTTGDLPLGPARAMDEVLKSTETMLNDLRKNPANEDKIVEAFSKRLVTNTIEPLIKNMSDKERTDLVRELKTGFEEWARQHAASGLKPKEAEAFMKAEVNKMLGSTKVHSMGEGMTAGDNGWVGKIAEHIGRLFGKGKDFDDIDARMIRPSPSR